MKIYAKKHYRISVYAAIIALALIFFPQNAKIYAEASVEQDIIALFGNNYQAEKSIPKKIFAKTLAEFLELPVKKYYGCYKDVKKNDEFTKFICAVKRAKIFEGCNKTKFLPESKVNWGFAIKSLCRAKNWTPKKTFKACLAEAKKKGFLALPLPKKPSSRSFITYKELAILLNRIADSYGTNAPAVSVSENSAPIETSEFNPEIPQRQTESVSFSPAAEQQIPVNFFSNVTLAAPLPNHFYKDEIYFIEGNLTNASLGEVFAFLCPADQNCDNSIDFLEKTINGRFKIPVYFRETGNFQLGIIPGTSGQSRIADISVLPAPSPPAGGQAATELNAKYAEGKTVFSWKGDSSLSRLIIFQGQKRKDYISRQNIKSFAPPAEDFTNFNKDAAGWTVAQNNANAPIQQINLTVQNFRKIETAEIQIKNLQEVFGAPGNFTFTAKSLAPISKRAALTLPNGQVRELIFSSVDLAAQQDFKIETNLESPGTYIFEVNNPDGAAVVNAPIYVGNLTPLLPDFFALNPAELNTAPLSNLDAARQKMLALINADRTAHNLESVKLNPELNAIAQGHSGSMVRNNFFGHIDPVTNLNPEGRRKKAGYPAAIRENLGKASNLELTEAGLMRSPLHREIIIDPNMKLVGLGIAKNNEGYYIVTQNFSEQPILADDLPSIENELFQKAVDFRTNNNLPSLIHNSSLRAVASNWSALMAEQGFFSVSNDSGDSLLYNVRQSGVTSSIRLHIVKAGAKIQLEEELSDQTTLSDASNRNIGIGLGLNNIGEIFMTVIYTP